MSLEAQLDRLRAKIIGLQTLTSQIKAEADEGVRRSQQLVRRAAATELEQGTQIKRVIDEEIARGAQRIVESLDKQIDQLKALVQPTDHAMEDEAENEAMGAHAALHELVEAAENISLDAAADICEALESSVADCQVRLENSAKAIADAADRWASKLNNIEDNVITAFDTVDADAQQVWTSVSAQLNGLIADSIISMQDRIEKLRARMIRLGECVEAGAASLSFSQRATSTAMDATQGALGLVTDILDDTTALFKEL